MSFRSWMYVWLVILGLLLYEHLAINYFPHPSFLVTLHSRGFLHWSEKVSTGPGKTLSYIYGFVGFGLMLMTNFYILRKRLGFMRGLGDLKHWLDVHIFFGVTGPTFIIFHSDFKVRGIVAISFWSMIVAASSGFVGRYFYLNVARRQKGLQSAIDKALDGLVKLLPKDKAEDEKFVVSLVTASLSFMGGNAPRKLSFFQLPGFVTLTMLADVKCLLGMPVIASFARTPIDEQLKTIGRLRRSESYADTYQRLLSYWHTFHLPFTFFMYVTAIIHIASSLIFKV